MTTILVVEDEPDIAHVMAELLQDVQYRTLNSTGPDAFTLAKERRPDLILLDLLLERTHGEELFKQLRADPATRTIPIIIYSALSNVAEITRQLQPDAALVKPFPLEQLLAYIKDVLRKSRLRARERVQDARVEPNADGTRQLPAPRSSC